MLCRRRRPHDPRGCRAPAIQSPFPHPPASSTDSSDPELCPSWVFLVLTVAQPSHHPGTRVHGPSSRPMWALLCPSGLPTAGGDARARNPGPRASLGRGSRGSSEIRFPGAVPETPGRRWRRASRAGFAGEGRDGREAPRPITARRGLPGAANHRPAANHRSVVLRCPPRPLLALPRGPDPATSGARAPARGSVRAWPCTLVCPRGLHGALEGRSEVPEQRWGGLWCSRTL